MQLAQTIKANYYHHLSELPLGKQIHFCTRLAAWDGDQRALDYLRGLKDQFVPVPYTDQAMRDILQALLIGPASGETNASQLREPFFQKYPALRTTNNTLFRVRHLLSVYGIDTRPLFLELMPVEKLLELKAQLLADDAAMRILSTYAINYIYLLERVILQHEDTASIDLNYFYNLGKDYNLDDPQELQLYIYLYTHCIIGETNFYIRRIPEALLPTYRQMIADLEKAIDAHYSDIHLDNKLEFLVCCQIVGYTSALAERIYEECEKSISTDGHFLVDRHNTNAQSSHTDIASSEHRNVLYIMSQSAFTPHATLAN